MALSKETIFKYGFTYQGIPYGWSKKQLYRLPYSKEQKHYKYEKQELIKVGNRFGYLVARDRKSMKQLEKMTEEINYTYKYYIKTVL
jgi:hypothetical protein